MSSVPEHSSHNKPETLSIRPEGIPKSLRGEEFNSRWILWRYVKRDGKWTKIPYSAETRKPIDATKIGNGTTFAGALQVFQSTRSFDGIGFILGDGIAGIDVDDCFVEDKIDERGKAISELFKGTYAEISPSGTGFKLLVHIDPDVKVLGHKKNGVEIYSERRYFAITGHRMPTHPSKVAHLPGEFAIAIKRLGAHTPQQQQRKGALTHESPGTIEDLRKVARALRYLSSDDYDTWQRYAAAMRRAFRHDEALEVKAYNLWHRWSKESEKYGGEDDCEYRWQHADTADSPEQPVTIATIIHDGKLAKQEQDNETRGVGRVHHIEPDDDWGDLPSVNTYIDKLLTSGLHLLIAPPKFGKTWLMIQLGYALSNGLQVLGEKTTGPYKVALLALEEGDEFYERDEPDRMHPSIRVKRRLRAMHIQPKELKRVGFVYEIPPYGSGGIAYIEEVLREHDVVIIDSLAMLRVGADERRELSIWNKDYDFVKPLQRMASSAGKCIVLLTHTGKGANAKDPMDAIAGTQGLQAAVDGMWIMQKPDFNDLDRVRLTITGRDVSGGQYEMRWDPDNRCWEMLGRWINLSPRMRETLEFLLSVPFNERRGFTYEQIVQGLSYSLPNARQYVMGLMHAGLAETISGPRTLQRGRAAVLVRATAAAYTRAGRGNEVDQYESNMTDMI